MTVSDWIDIAKLVFPYVVAGVGLLWGWVRGKYRLHPTVIAILKQLERAGVSIESIHCLLETASDMADMTKPERQVWAREKLQEIAIRNGVTVSDSAANNIIEWAYKQVKSR